MNIKELAKQLDIQLRNEQFKYAEAIEWLLTWDITQQRLGRSTLLALGFISLAINNKGKVIYLFDHAESPHSKHITQACIKDLIKNIPNYTFTITNNSIICCD